MSSVSLTGALAFLQLESRKMVDLVEAKNWEGLLECGSLALMSPQSIEKLIERYGNDPKEQKSVVPMLFEIAENAKKIGAGLEVRKNQISTLITTAERQHESEGGYGKKLNQATYSMRDICRGGAHEGRIGSR